MRSSHFPTLCGFGQTVATPMDYSDSSLPTRTGSYGRYESSWGWNSDHSAEGKPPDQPSASKSPSETNQLPKEEKIDFIDFALFINDELSEDVAFQDSQKSNRWSPSSERSLFSRTQVPLQYLGKGGFASVEQGMEHNVAFAMKRINLSISNKSAATRGEGHLEHLMREIRILNHPPLSSHPNILHMFGVGWSVRPGDSEISPLLYLELATHGTLSDVFSKKGPIDSSTKSDLAIDIIQGLLALHKCNIAHGDLKFENVLVFADGINYHGLRAVLSDFGESYLFTENCVKLRAITRPWNAPEIIAGQEYTIDQLQKADTYSYGLLYWKMMNDGNMPFDLSWTDRRSLSMPKSDFLDNVDERKRQPPDFMTGFVIASFVKRFTNPQHIQSLSRRVTILTVRLNPEDRNLEAALRALNGRS